jgi:hypothetical protein
MIAENDEGEQLPAKAFHNPLQISEHAAAILVVMDDVLPRAMTW